MGKALPEYEALGSACPDGDFDSKILHPIDLVKISIFQFNVLNKRYDLICASGSKEEL